MKIKNKNISASYDLLLDLKLNIKESRLRSRFCRLLQEYFMKTILPDTEDIKVKFAKKDEDGKVIYDKSGKFTIPPEQMNEFMSIMEEVDNEFFHIEMNEQNKNMLVTVSTILLENENLEVYGETALIHDELCEEAEKVLEHYNN